MIYTAKVRLRDSEDLDSMLRRFKKQVMSEEIIQECRRRQFFLKKALKRKEKSKQARIRALRRK